ncbi:hypothetical protein ACVWXU_005233 [Streptomyces sp. TE33382]
MRRSYCSKLGGYGWYDLFEGDAEYKEVSDLPVFSPDWTATLLELGGARPGPAGLLPYPTGS